MRAHLAVAGLASISLLACADAPPPEGGGDTPPDSAAAGDSTSLPYTPGEQQRDVDLSRNPLALYPTGEGQNLRQTFTPTADAELGYIEIPVACTDGVLLNVKLRDDSNAILYEANARGLDGPVDGTFKLIQLFDPAVSTGIRLQSGRTYSFELAAFPGPTAVSRTCGMAPGPAGNTYARGQGFFQDPVNGPDFIPLPDGGPSSDEDLPFVTRVR